MILLDHLNTPDFDSPFLGNTVHLYDKVSKLGSVLDSVPSQNSGIEYLTNSVFALPFTRFTTFKKKRLKNFSLDSLDKFADSNGMFLPFDGLSNKERYYRELDKLKWLKSTAEIDLKNFKSNKATIVEKLDKALLFDIPGLKSVTSLNLYNGDGSLNPYTISELDSAVAKFCNTHSSNWYSEQFGLDTFDLASYIRLNLTEYVEINYQIEQARLKLSLIDRVLRAVNFLVKRLLLNKREVFRKINSFHFKNLDDYHSFTFLNLY